MNEELKLEMQAGDKKRKRYNQRMRTGDMVCTYGAHWLPYDGEVIRPFNLISRIILIIILIDFGLDFWGVLIAYAAIHIITYVVGKMVRNAYNEKIKNLEQEWQDKLSAFFRERLLERGLNASGKDFEDGVSVSHTGFVSARLEEHQLCKMNIYNLDNFEDSEKFKECKRAKDMSYLILNDSIASVDFNKKWGVVSYEFEKLEAMKYLTPTKQLKLLKTPAEKFYNIKIDGSLFFANVKRSLKYPEGVNMYQKKKLIQYFETVEKYCIDLEQMTNEIHAEFEEMRFLFKK